MSSHTFTVRITLEAADEQRAKIYLGHMLHIIDDSSYEFIDDQWRVTVQNENGEKVFTRITDREDALICYGQIVQEYMDKLRGGGFESAEYGDGSRRCWLTERDVDNKQKITISLQTVSSDIPF
jgi:hypothetical protein